MSRTDEFDPSALRESWRRGTEREQVVVVRLGALKDAVDLDALTRQGGSRRLLLGDLRIEQDRALKQRHLLMTRAFRATTVRDESAATMDRTMKCRHSTMRSDFL